MTYDFGFNVGDDLYVAFKDDRKVCRFKTDCIKVFDDGVTVHGYVYGLCGSWGVSMEFNLKHLNKRVLFNKKTNADKWLDAALAYRQRAEH